MSQTDGSPPGKNEKAWRCFRRLQARGELSDEVGHFGRRDFFIGLFELAAPGFGWE